MPVALMHGDCQCASGNNPCLITSSGIYLTAFCDGCCKSAHAFETPLCGKLFAQEMHMFVSVSVDKWWIVSSIAENWTELPRANIAYFYHFLNV